MVGAAPGVEPVEGWGPPNTALLLQEDRVGSKLQAMPPTSHPSLQGKGFLFGL